MPDSTCPTWCREDHASPAALSWDGPPVHLSEMIEVSPDLSVQLAKSDDAAALVYVEGIAPLSLDDAHQLGSALLRVYCKALSAR